MKRLWILSFALASAPVEIFTDVSDIAGITWRHFNGESADRFLIETSCGGVAMLDYDGDGLLDFYLVNGGETRKGKSKTPVRNALYRNLGNGKFEEVAAKAGVDKVNFFGMGVAAADYDNDGFQDLFVTGYPASALFRNNGNGMYSDVTKRAGVQNAGEWGASAAWFDYDRDGRLDLLVTNYAELSFTEPPRCEYAGEPVYCLQTAYRGRPLRLFHNEGDGRFKDASATSGIAQHVGRAFGVVAVDANDDGWIDLFVARDASPNLLLINQRNGTFRDLALEAEVAYSSEGMARAGMGVDAGDINGDGRPDFVVTNFNSEYHALYLNRDTFPYDERTLQSRLAAFTWPHVGWGTRLLDYDNDGDLDVVIVNGHINATVERSQQGISYRQPPLLLANDGKGVFRNLKDTAGPVFRKPYLGRGLAAGDYDNDGDTDLIFVSLNEKPVLLRNNAGQKLAWIGFELQGTASNRDAIGAKLKLRTGGLELVRWVTGGGSFLASHDRRVIFGLGAAPASRSVSVEIRWPNGGTQTVSGLEPNRYHRIIEPRQ
jgi:hypothetical protein